MKNRKRIIVLASAGLVVAALVLGLGAVMKQNADYSDGYVARQMAQQRISFKPAEQLTEAEAARPCVVANAGKPLRTGAQAECFANDYIAVHLAEIGQGKTYAELGAEEFALKAKLESATPGTARHARLEGELAELRATRDLLFKGETLRGILLTSFGFSTLGDKAAQAATVAFGVGGVLGALAALTLAWGLIAGRVRAARPVGQAAAAAS